MTPCGAGSKCSASRPRCPLPPGAIQRLPPLLGEHTEEVLKGLGYSLSQIEALEKERIVRRNGQAAG